MSIGQDFAPLPVEDTFVVQANAEKNQDDSFVDTSAFVLLKVQEPQEFSQNGGEGFAKAYKKCKKQEYHDMLIEAILIQLKHPECPYKQEFTEKLMGIEAVWGTTRQLVWPLTMRIRFQDVHTAELLASMCYSSQCDMKVPIELPGRPTLHCVVTGKARSNAVSDLLTLEIQLRGRMNPGQVLCDLQQMGINPPVLHEDPHTGAFSAIEDPIWNIFQPPSEKLAALDGETLLTNKLRLEAKKSDVPCWEDMVPFRVTDDQGNPVPVVPLGPLCKFCRTDHAKPVKGKEHPCDLFEGEPGKEKLFYCPVPECNETAEGASAAAWRNHHCEKVLRAKKQAVQIANFKLPAGASPAALRRLQNAQRAALSGGNRKRARSRTNNGGEPSTGAKAAKPGDGLEI